MTEDRGQNTEVRRKKTDMVNIETFDPFGQALVRTCFAGMTMRKCGDCRVVPHQLGMPSTKSASTHTVLVPENWYGTPRNNGRESEAPIGTYTEKI